MNYLRFTLIMFLCSVQVIKAQTPQELKAMLPQITGWSISDKIEVFDEENLFDRINGAAPLFIENNFIEMTALEYMQGDDYITIQAYRHATPEDAFGMYASERSPGLNHFPIGGEAQGDDASMFFFAGNMYIKMWGKSSKDVSNELQKIAERFAGKIDENAAYPVLVNVFPKENKVEFSEAYITSSYIGHQFLKGVYVAKYIQDGKPYQLFLIDAKTKDGAREIINKYFTFTKQSLDFKEGKLEINDRYNGNIPAIWKGQYIIGVFSENGDKIDKAETILDDFSINLLNI